MPQEAFQQQATVIITAGLYRGQARAGGPRQSAIHG